MTKEVTLICAYCENKELYELHWSSSILFSKCKLCKKETRFEYSKWILSKSKKN